MTGTTDNFGFLNARWRDGAPRCLLEELKQLSACATISIRRIGCYGCGAGACTRVGCRPRRARAGSGMCMKGYDGTGGVSLVGASKGNGK